MKEDTKKCIRYLIIGALWIAVSASIAFIISIVG